MRDSRVIAIAVEIFWIARDKEDAFGSIGQTTRFEDGFGGKDGPNNWNLSNPNVSQCMGKDTLLEDMQVVCVDRRGLVLKETPGFQYNVCLE